MVSVVSTGTELAKIALGARPLWGKARQRPDQVAKVLDSARQEGLGATIRKVQERLAAPQPLGYSAAGIVVECGAGVTSLRAGLPVACGGISACHAEVIVVPETLTIRVPPGVPLASAAYTTIAAIAMQGIRNARIGLGDRVLVIGLGLIGQLTVRLAAAAGVHVFGVDPRNDRADLASSSGAEAAHTSLDPATAQAVVAWSGGRGADAVIITASGADNGPLVLAGMAARDRARVVAVGAFDLDVPREPFYMKELSLIVSRSYGPGRYDVEFEEKGHTYPPGFVPWTERRNMEEFLSLLQSGKINLDGLRGLALPFDRAPEGYHALSGKDGPSPISLVLEYPAPEMAPSSAAPTPRPEIVPADVSTELAPRSLRVSFVGAGNFAFAHLLPAVSAVPGAALVRVVTSSPLKAETARRRWGFRAAGSSSAEIWTDADTAVVFVATRHDSHAAYAEAALRAHKAVFVEKPLALSEADLERVRGVLRATRGRLMVGFNRRFAPAIQWALERIGADREGLRFLCRVNAGPLAADHWLLDPEIGGGRLVGEGCHFVDLACHVAASPPTEVFAKAMDRPAPGRAPQDFTIHISFQNGAAAVIEYISSGDASLPKERFEIHRQGASVVVEDFREATSYRAGKVKRAKWGFKDKGHRAEVRAFLEAVRAGAVTPIPEEESLRSSALTLAAVRALTEMRVIPFDGW
jgi:predicted dehydrogenase